MMIKSIQLSNFGCYKGTHSVITFSTDSEKNVTVILGANKSGKTTLVQAFLWCLYGEVRPKEGIINSEVKTEMLPSTSRDVFVEIILTHAGKDYTVRRTQRFNKANERVRSEDSVLKVQYKESNGEQQAIPTRDCADTVNNILPKGLSDYFFYEGERFEDVSKRDVATAVRGLMGLDAISAARDRFDPSSSKSVTSHFQKRLALGSAEESERLNKSLTKAQEEHESIIKRMATEKSEQEFFQRRKDELEEQLSKNAVVKTLQDKRKTLESDIQVGQRNIEQAAKRILSDFQRGSLAFFALPLIDRALVAIEDSNQDGEGIPEMRQGAIDHILERGRCICGLDLKENEGARKRIIAERSLLPPEHLGTILYNHKQALISFRDSSSKYVEETKNNYANWRRNIRFVDDKNDDLKRVGNEIAAAGFVDVSALEAEYQKNEEKLNELGKLRERLLVNKGAEERDIDNIQKKIAALAKKTDSNKKIQRYIAYSEELFKWFDSSYSRREKEVKNALNESVNRIFSDMYHGHRIVTIDDNYQIKLFATVGATQEEIPETGGLRAVKNFAYITGLVDIARKKITDSFIGNSSEDDFINKTEPYPLIMDAPFSATDEKHIENISRIVPGIAEQVIIIVMQKDWIYAKPMIWNKVGKSYSIDNIENSETSSRVREAECYVHN